jgi:predicted ribosome quality control (RQC) complex YloA/Tae2 family protein
MYFDALTLAAVADDLQGQVGGRIQEVVLVDELSVGMEVYLPPLRRYLLISAHPQLARVHFASDKLRRGVETPSPLLLLLRRDVRDARLASVQQAPHERILRLGFHHHEQGATTLLVEVMGKHSNIILLDADDIVLDSIKRVGPDVNRYRTILPRQPYVAPPAQEKLSPEELTGPRLREILAASAPSTPVWRALVNGVRGVSPLLARELTYRACGLVEAEAQAGLAEPLLGQFERLVWPTTRAAWEPCVAVQDSEITDFAPYTLRHLGSFERTDTIGQAIERYVQAQTHRDPYGATKRQVRLLIVGALKQVERKRGSLQRSLRPQAEIDRLRESGEMLLAYAHEVKPGQTRLTVEWTPEEPPLQIDLDPKLTPSENAQHLFDQYIRAKKAAKELPPMLVELELSERYLRQLSSDLDLAANGPEIDEVRAALEEAGYVKETPKRSRAARSRPLSVQSVDGLTIWVGKNSRQNDELTHRAAGADLWLHARGIPGSHVIVQTQGKPIPQATLLQAAALAAYYSAGRADRSVAVDYTERRYVKRIKGAAPGLVTYAQENTVHVEPKGA